MNLNPNIYGPSPVIAASSFHEQTKHKRSYAEITSNDASCKKHSFVEMATGNVQPCSIENSSKGADRIDGGNQISQTTREILFQNSHRLK